MRFVHPLQVAYLAATRDQRFGDVTTSAAPGAHNKGAEALQTALVMARLLRAL